MTEALRLDKLVSDIFKITRKQAKYEISRGSVTVNGEVCKDASKHFSAADKVACNGIEKEYRKFVYIMMNKPEGVISASKDKQTRTAIDLLPRELYQKDLFVAGRLDKNTTGFLLITNDGEFAHNILSPKKHVNKTYLVKLSASMSGKEVLLFSNGIMIGEYKCKPAALEILDSHTARVTIREGKFHQIKRMFYAVDNDVVTLHREKIGNLPLDASLTPGQARYITDKELKLLENGEKKC